MGKSRLNLFSCMPGCGLCVGKNGLNVFNCWSVAIHARACATGLLTVRYLIANRSFSVLEVNFGRHGDTLATHFDRIQ